VFKAPRVLPTRYSEVHELADYVELRCWLNNRISAREVIRYLVQRDDNEVNEGCGDDEDEIQDRVDDILVELENRAGACAKGYPFLWTQARSGQVLNFDLSSWNKAQKVVYLYLLLSTRLDMSKDRVHRGLDGTHLLERLSEQILKVFLGPRAKTMIFGSSAGKSFEQRVKELVRELGEGGGVRNRGRTTARMKDGGIDTVGWIPFADKKPGKIIMFGQSKTGTRWRNDLNKLRPADFAKMWLMDAFVVDPVRVHFIAESIGNDEWHRWAFPGGVLFDRCRLVEYGAAISDQLFEDLRAWTDAALQWVAEAMEEA